MMTIEFSLSEKKIAQKAKLRAQRVRTCGAFYLPEAVLVCSHATFPRICSQTRLCMTATKHSFRTHEQRVCCNVVLAKYCHGMVSYVVTWTPTRALLSRTLTTAGFSKVTEPSPVTAKAPPFCSAEFASKVTPFLNLLPPPPPPSPMERRHTKTTQKNKTRRGGWVVWRNDDDDEGDDDE